MRTNTKTWEEKWTRNLVSLILVALFKMGLQACYCPSQVMSSVHSRSLLISVKTTAIRFVIFHFLAFFLPVPRFCQTYRQFFSLYLLNIDPFWRPRHFENHCHASLFQHAVPITIFSSVFWRSGIVMTSVASCTTKHCPVSSYYLSL